MATHQATPELNPERILQVGLGFWASKTLLSAVELGIFTELARGSRSLHSLIEKLQLHSRLIETPGGFDYTGAACCGWMKDAGFRETGVEHLLGPDSMVIGIK